MQFPHRGQCPPGTVPDSSPGPCGPNQFPPGPSCDPFPHNPNAHTVELRPYTVTKLITNGYYLSGILARNLQTITGDQIEDGLDLLNAWIAIKSANLRLIPYFTQFSFFATIGQERYFIPNLISVETFTFFIGPVRYSTLPQKRVTYFGSGRIENIDSLPFSWHLERTFGGAHLYIYFKPNVNYPLQILGKFQLCSVSLNQDLRKSLDQFYIEYLRYGLSEQICAEYNIPMQPQAYQRLREIEKIITDVSVPDLQMQKMSSLHEGGAWGYSYADANLGRGWRP